MAVAVLPKLPNPKSGSAIVFDPIKQTLSVRKLKNLDSKSYGIIRTVVTILTGSLVTKAACMVSVPRFSNKVEVFARWEDDTKRLVVTLDLG